MDVHLRQTGTQDIMAASEYLKLYVYFQVFRVTRCMGVEAELVVYLGHRLRQVPQMNSLCLGGDSNKDTRLFQIPHNEKITWEQSNSVI